MPVNIQDLVGQGSDQPDLVENSVLTVEVLDLVISGSPFQHKLYDSVIHLSTYRHMQTVKAKPRIY